MLKLPDALDNLRGGDLVLGPLKQFKERADAVGLQTLLAGRVKAMVGKSTGTTVLAMIYKDGAVIAGDRRATSGHTHEDDYVKVEETANSAMIACAGSVPYIQELVKNLKLWIEILEREQEAPVYVNDQAGVLSAILRANFEYLQMLIYFLGYYAVPIMAGYDVFKNCGRVYEFDEAGGVERDRNFVTAGSGGNFAKLILMDSWRGGMDAMEAARLAIRAIMRASYDIYTSSPLLAPPTVSIISESGILSLDEPQVLALSWKIYLEDLKRFGKKSHLDFFDPKEVK